MWHAHGAVGPKREGNEQLQSPRKAVWPKRREVTRGRDHARALGAMPAIWLVEEDKPGRWRQFPEDLSDLVEGRWQLWQEADQEPHFVVEYTWKIRGVENEYEICFDRPYMQAKSPRRHA